MARVRNISSDELELRWLPGSPTVAPDGVLDVDDDLFKGYAWPETVWTVVSAPTSKKKG